MKITLENLTEKLNLQAVVLPQANIHIQDGYTSDLLSDVMANAPSESALITIQAHRNTVAVASLAGIKAIIICNGRPIPEDMKEAASKENIGLLSTQENQFTISGKLYAIIKG